jgi:hypothetical protein
LALPEFTVSVETNATAFSLAPGDGFIDVEYRGATRLVLRTAVHRP